MRHLSCTLALLAAVTLGFNLPAHAENAAKKRAPSNAGTENTQLEELKKKLMERLRKSDGQRLRMTDVRGNPVTPDELFAKPEAFHDGLQVSIDEEKLEVRGELIANGKKGVKIFVTHLGAGNRIVNGQVITIAPGMTKQDVQKRFEDAVESLMMFKDVAQKPGSEKRGVASKGSGGDNLIPCLLTFGIAISTLFMLYHAATPGSGNVLSAAWIAVITGTIAYVIGSEACFGNDSSPFSKY